MAVALLRDLEAAQREQSIPLLRPDEDPLPFPVAALGPILGGACYAIQDIVQVADGIAAQSVLAAATLVVQAHVDVVLPTKSKASPSSLFFVTIARSGDRKSSADTLATQPIEDWQRERYPIWQVEQQQFERDKQAFDIARKQAEKQKGYDAVRTALAELPNAPQPPLMPILMTSDPTLEGLLKLMQVGQPALGIMADEGGSFLGGPGMSSENRLRTITGLSKLWDGSPVNRVRAGEGATIIRGKRLSLHIMLQPDMARTFLSDTMMRDQGFHSRILVSAPHSLMGTRMQRQPSVRSCADLRHYNDRLTAILYRPKLLREGSRNELEPRRLSFASDAAERWYRFANEVEVELRQDGRYHSISGFAGKLPEHAARLAAVLECIEDVEATNISLESFYRAITLTSYYAEEALRLYCRFPISPEIVEADGLLKWLNSPKWESGYICTSALMQFGPKFIREKKVADRAIRILEAHGHLVRAGRAFINEQVGCSNKAWRIIRQDSLP